MAEISGLPAPDTQPTSALSISLPSPPSLHELSSLPTSPTPTQPSLTTLRAWVPLYLSKTDTLLTQLSRILSTPSGTDTVLLTLAYTTLLSSSLLQKVSLYRLHHRAHAILLAAASLPPKTTVLLANTTIQIPISRLSLLATRLKALSVLIGDFRIFARLFGLLGIYAWGKSVWANKEKEGDKILRTVAYTQVLVNALFQVLENAAYLSSKGVLGLKKEQQDRAWVWSSRYWMSHVLLDFVRLARERSLRLAGTTKEKGEDGLVIAEEKSWRESWTRQLVTNTAWLPLTAHWSTDTGIVSEFWVGVFGTVAGVTGLRARWRDAGI